MRAVRIIILAWLAATFLVGSAVPALARTQPKVLINGTDPVKMRYSGLATNPSGNVVFAKPADCVSTPYCDVVRVEVKLPPDYDDNTDEFSTSIVLDFATTKAGDRITPDLDLTVYDVNGARIATSATANAPEQTAVADQVFDVVVNNASGVNLEYFLTFQFKIKRIPPFVPSGSGGGSPAPAAGSSENPAGSAPPGSNSPAASSSFPSSSPSSPTPRSSISKTTPLSPTAPFAVAPAPLDAPAGAPLITPTLPDEAGFLGATDAEPASGSAFGFSGAPSAAALPVGPAGPVAPAVLIFWLGVVPLALLGAGGFLVRRRAPSVLRLG